MGNAALESCHNPPRGDAEEVFSTGSPISSTPSGRTNALPAARRRDSTKIRDDPLYVALTQMQKDYPFLKEPSHDLYSWVEKTLDAIEEKDEAEAKECLARIEQEVEQEQRTLQVTFKMFCQGKDDAMDTTEVGRMLEYLGFPATEADIADIMKATDADADHGTMSLDEFQAYVAKMGGSYQLFERRRKYMEAKHGGGAASPGGGMDPKVLSGKMKEAGVMEQEQAYWRLVLPRVEQEFHEAAILEKCQKNAVRQIRQLARSSHERAMPELQRKVQSLGCSDNDLWMTLAYIRELAPIIVHLNLTKMMQYLETDTHYRNQFETATSGGLLKPTVREKWERGLFGSSYDGAKGKDRPKYGVLNAMNDHRGVVKCHQYGDSYFVLKDSRLRCTFSPEDSANLKSDRLAVLDFYGHVLNEYSTDELKETLKIAKSSDAAVLGNSEKVGNMKYKETQIHGELCFARHVERLVAHTKHRGPDSARLKKICEKHGWKFSWMDEEQARMKREDKGKMGEDAWKEKLKKLMDDRESIEVEGVPEGYCKKGCGRKVAPGKTAAGNPFKTCCRGCALGFGHDLNCGNIDPEKMKPGMCINGCGRKVNPGRTASGRRFTTCCRGCIKGKHDATCGQVLETGMCKIGCGRRVAPPSGGRVFDTCCRLCASSKGETHDARCQASNQ